MKHISSAYLGWSFLYEYHVLKGVCSFVVWFGAGDCIRRKMCTYLCIAGWTIWNCWNDLYLCGIPTWSPGSSCFIRALTSLQSQSPSELRWLRSSLLSAIITQHYSLGAGASHSSVCKASFWWATEDLFYELPTVAVLHLTHSGRQEGRVCSHVKIDTPYSLPYFQVISGTCMMFGCNCIGISCVLT